LIYNEVDIKALLATWPQKATSPTFDQAINGIWHYMHSFDYLRPGVQCLGDTSLEFVLEFTGTAVVDELNWPHECKSWDAILEYAEKYA
jgi:hypothetical protein